MDKQICQGKISNSHHQLIRAPSKFLSNQDTHNKEPTRTCDNKWQARKPPLCRELNPHKYRMTRHYIEMDDIWKIFYQERAKKKKRKKFE